MFDTNFVFVHYYEALIFLGRINYFIIQKLASKSQAGYTNFLGFLVDYIGQLIINTDDFLYKLFFNFLGIVPLVLLLM